MTDNTSGPAKRDMWAWVQTCLFLASALFVIAAFIGFMIQAVGWWIAFPLLVGFGMILAMAAEEVTLPI